MALSIKHMVGLLLSIVVFASLMPTIANDFAALSNSSGTTMASNITGAPATLLGLGTLFVAIIFIYGLVRSIR